MNRRGFTLLEVLVAATIMGIAVVGVLSGLSATMHNAARLTDYDRAVMLGRSKMDELLLDPQFPRDTVVQGNFDSAMTGGIEAGWQAELKRFEASTPPAPGEQALDRMELQIWWTSNGRRRTFAVNGYKTELLRPEDLHP